MTKLRLDQLPAAARARVEAQIAAPPARKKKGKRTVEGPGVPLTCTRCGERIDNPTDGALSRHAEQHGAARFEWRPEPPEPQVG